MQTNKLNKLTQNSKIYLKDRKNNKKKLIKKDFKSNKE